jgi:hypothetical protein
LDAQNLDSPAEYVSVQLNFSLILRRTEGGRLLRQKVGQTKDLLWLSGLYQIGPKSQRRGEEAEVLRMATMVVWCW